MSRLNDRALQAAASANRPTRNKSVSVKKPGFDA
jgi:hypothetical protein